MTFPLRIGIGTGNRLPFPELAGMWREIEELGFDSAWVVDHFLAGQDELTPYFEAWTLIAALSQQTSRIRFGIMVSGNTYRNPALVAKQAVTIDHASGGRVELGIGAGWWEREHEAYGYTFPPVRDRVEMLEEAAQVITSLLTQERTTFHGAYYTFENTPFEPKSLQKPHLPLVIGAFKPRMLRIAARYADNWNTRGEPEEIAPLAETMRKAARDVGRDPEAIRFSVYAWKHPFTSEEHFRDIVARYHQAGFSDLIFPMPPAEDRPMMERIARQVIPELRAQYAPGAGAGAGASAE
ncbi:MAG TPA: TIGR03560 family F420-dependent LLM class oxidoreductase [Nitrolancea sp.]|nr:TIGR03560 family F420-dependent LLM class oxidoreductase [Nitrolancea sp.]